MNDPLIDRLIQEKGAKQIYSGFDYTRSYRLTPNGDAAKDKVLAERLQPATELRSE